jgi:hypothetical protein
MKEGGEVIHIQKNRAPLFRLSGIKGGGIHRHAANDLISFL